MRTVFVGTYCTKDLDVLADPLLETRSRKITQAKCNAAKVRVRNSCYLKHAYLVKQKDRHLF